MLWGLRVASSSEIQFPLYSVLFYTIQHAMLSQRCSLDYLQHKNSQQHMRPIIVIFCREIFKSFPRTMLWSSDLGRLLLNEGGALRKKGRLPDSLCKLDFTSSTSCSAAKSLG